MLHATKEVVKQSQNISERQQCLQDAAHLRKQSERASAPSDSAEDRQACPMRCEMNRLLKLSAEM
jgi:hypothetical protein